MKTLRKYIRRFIKNLRMIMENLIDYIPPEARRFLPMAGLVIIVLLLVIVIVLAQSCGRRNSEEPVDTNADLVFEDIVDETISPLSESEGEYADEAGYDDYEYEAETEPETVPETEPDYGRLTKNGDPELQAVMERYFTARSVADLDTINELYGITDETEEERAENLEVLQFNARYVSSFDNINTYVMDGPYADNWLVYTTADVKFYTAFTKAPTIMWCYIEKDEDGDYLILDSHALTEDLIEYADEENHSPEVRALASDINTSLVLALQTDPDLAEVYGVLRSGSPLWENTAEAETEVAVIEEAEVIESDEEYPAEYGEDTDVATDIEAFPEGEEIEGEAAEDEAVNAEEGTEAEGVIAEEGAEGGGEAVEGEAAEGGAAEGEAGDAEAEGEDAA